MVGKCKLCHEDKKLCKQSHIIPNFMYQDLLDENHRMHVVQTKDGVIKTRIYRKTGEFDKFILCQSCDNGTLGKLDRYASLILYDGLPKIFENRTSPDGRKYTYCAEIDYAQFKLFLLSILWRSSISNRPLFSEVRLGPHEERIRKMLLQSDPGEPLKYPCVMMTYLNLKEYSGDIVAQPSRSRVKGRYVYKFLIGGITYIFGVSENSIPSEWEDAIINLKGEMKIVHLSPRSARRVFASMTGIK